MEHSTPPAVDVTIGGQTRIYHVYITTAPVTFDGPSALTLYESSFTDVAGFAADPIPFDRDLARTTARLVLIGSTELAWQRARYSGGAIRSGADRSGSGRPQNTAALALEPPRGASSERGALMSLHTHGHELTTTDNCLPEGRPHRRARYEHVRQDRATSSLGSSNSMRI
jgi:hypothetical protein